MKKKTKNIVFVRSTLIKVESQGPLTAQMLSGRAALSGYTKQKAQQRLALRRLG